jgi:hypothetical protein
MKKAIFLSLSLFILFVSGCETLPPPTPQQIITNPLGTTPLRRGMTKEEIVALWGQPNKIVKKGRDELGVPKEEWIYDARYPAVPVDYNYLSKTKKLFFEGNNLVNWESSP